MARAFSPSPLPSPVMPAAPRPFRMPGLRVSDGVELWQLAICGGKLFKPKGCKTRAVRRCWTPLSARNPAGSAQASRGKTPSIAIRPGRLRRLARRIPAPSPALPPGVGRPGGHQAARRDPCRASGADRPRPAAHPADAKGSQTDAVTVPPPSGQTALCQVRALTSWEEAAGAQIGQRPVASRPNSAQSTDRRKLAATCSTG
jgi:hypothetical protein